MLTDIQLLGVANDDLVVEYKKLKKYAEKKRSQLNQELIDENQSLKEENQRLRNCIYGLYKELGKKHKNVCFDPDCDGTCYLEKHPYAEEPIKKTT